MNALPVSLGATGFPARTFRLLSMLLILAFASIGASAAESAAEWLDIAADARAGSRQREYAASQLIMLADASASILIAAVRGDGSESGLRRQVAARILGETNIPGAEAVLLESVAGRDHFLAEAAKDALTRLYSRLSAGELYALYTKGARERHSLPEGDLGDGDDWIYLSLRQAEMRGRFKALVMRGMALKYASSDEVLPEPLSWCVWDGLVDPERELRRAALDMAPRVRNSLATEKLAAFLYMENDPGLLTAALRVMALLAPSDYGQAVERHIRHDDPMVALEACAALTAMGYPGTLFPEPSGGRSVAGFVLHPSTPVRRRAMEILGGSRNPAAIEYLEAGLRDRVALNRTVAVKALGELGFTGSAGLLSPLLRDGRPDVRAEAAVALARMGVVGAAAAMVEDLRAASPPFRLAAAGALGRIGAADAVPELLNAAAGRDTELACASVEALGRIGDKAAGAGLYALLRAAREPAVSTCARAALAAIYRDDPGNGDAEREAWAARNGVMGP